MAYGLLNWTGLLCLVSSRLHMGQGGSLCWVGLVKKQCAWPRQSAFPTEARLRQIYS